VLLGLSGVGGVFNEQVITFYTLTVSSSFSSSMKYIQQLNAINMFGFLYFNCWDSTQVLKAMRESVSTKPAIFAMSNPTMNGLFVQGLFSTHNC